MTTVRPTLHGGMRHTGTGPRVRRNSGAAVASLLGYRTARPLRARSPRRRAVDPRALRADRRPLRSPRPARPRRPVHHPSRRCRASQHPEPHDTGRHTPHHGDQRRRYGFEPTHERDPGVPGALPEASMPCRILGSLRAALERLVPPRLASGVRDHIVPEDRISPRTSGSGRRDSRRPVPRQGSGDRSRSPRAPPARSAAAPGPSPAGSAPRPGRRSGGPGSSGAG